MKTIERRAILASEGYCDKEFSSGFCMGYQEGAREQRKIDIDKACEWLKERNVLRDVSIERFRQEMEE